ncbi:MAG: response regulator [Acidobacteriia bacterium]|nr:response regulator [Terriglobia bacterium]
MIVSVSPRPVVRQGWPGPLVQQALCEFSAPLKAHSGASQGSPSSGTGLNKLLLENKPGTETILYVEDEAVLRGVISDCLTQLGYQVLAAHNGKQALSISASHNGEIELLLTDVRLPEMAGPELAAEILAQRPEMKVIYVSGYPDDIVAAHGARAQGTVFLAKPFTIKILAAKLREVLG